MMNKKTRLCIIFISITVFIVFFTQKFDAQQECTEYSSLFTESFDTTDYKDELNSSVEHWGEGYITMNKIGANFNVANPEYMPAWINTVAANDFDGDGWPDLIGSSSSYSNVLAFVKNRGADGLVGTFEITRWIDGSEGSSGWPTKGVNGDSIDGSGHCGLTSGDYDADGDIDFLFIASNAGSPFSPKRIWLYENRLVEEGALRFRQIDKTSAWSNLLKGIAWSATMMVSIDFDNDNDLDILIANRAGEVRLIRNRKASRALDNSRKWSIVRVISTEWNSGRGISTLSIADFDADGDLDIIIGAVDQAELRYYKNDGNGVFSFFKSYSDPDGDTNDDEYDGAATVSIAQDFDNDGDMDLIIGTDNWNYRPGGERIGGMCYYFRNSGGNFSQLLIYDGRNEVPAVYDFDLGANLDFDKDGDYDFLIADGNHTENQYLFINELADVYNLQGVAQSVNISPALQVGSQAITKIRITDLNQHYIGRSPEGLAVEYYFSNDDGTNWELYARFEGLDIHAYNDLPWHTFKHYGSTLKWKAVLSAPEDPMVEYSGASFETPKIMNIGVEYIYVDRKEYSRTSVAATVMDQNEQQLKLIIAGSFVFPGWEGNLRAYDVSGMTPLNTGYSELRTVTRSNLTDPTGRDIVATGVNILWDAGQLLNARLPSSRNIYTAIPGSGGSSLSRVEFTEANVTILETYLQDGNGDDVGLINFVRGVGRDWRLGDINHSNPVVVGPPSGDPLLKGDGYATFMLTWKDRRKVLIDGANDGMLHCFDLLTGEELWGFIPFNLLPKLRNMWAVNPVTEERYFLRDVYVDGSPVVKDVKVNDVWKTIVICGQGPGSGSITGGGINYYFALDITDPSNPQPLWECTHPTMGETWSVPVIGKIVKDSRDTWVAFMGSGYDNDLDNYVGNYFYAVDISDGSIFWSFEAVDVDTSADFPNIPNSIPASPTIIDVNKDGYTDRVYLGDLDGRLWKVDVSGEFTSSSPWVAEAIYTDSKNYPIVTKPAVWANPSNEVGAPNIYFGTGGDEGAPADTTYSFVSFLDSSTPGVEWYLGDPLVLNLPQDKNAGDLGIGEKMWADPKIADYIVYFSTLTGTIESVDPCENLAGIGKLYGRYIVSKAGSLAGGTAFRSASGLIENLTLAIKTRSAVTLGEQAKTQSGIRKREVYIQEYDSTIQKLEQLTGGLLKVKSWREIRKILR